MNSLASVVGHFQARWPSLRVSIVRLVGLIAAAVVLSGLLAVAFAPSVAAAIWGPINISPTSSTVAAGQYQGYTASALCVPPGSCTVSYTHLTLPTNREV